MMKKLLIIFCLLLLPLCCHAQQSGDATAILTGGLYTLSTGNGGGNTTTISTVVQLVRGNFVVTPSNTVASTITAFVGNAFTAAVSICYDNGSNAPTDGTLTGTLTLSGTVVASNLPVTVRYGNLVTVAIPSSATANPGNLLLTITRSAGGDVQTFGPLIIRVTRP